MQPKLVFIILALATAKKRNLSVDEDEDDAVDNADSPKGWNYDYLGEDWPGLSLEEMFPEMSAEELDGMANECG